MKAQSSNSTEFSPDGTVAYVDINFPILVRTIGAGTPGLNTLQGNIQMIQWAVNDAQSIEATEMIHSWKEGTPVIWHIHIVTGGTNVDNRYTQWSIEYTWANYGTTFPANTTVNSGDLLIPANTPANTHFIYDVSTWTPVGGKIAAHVKARLKRIASVGTAPTANPFCEMVQLHVACDTVGSRLSTTK